MLQFSDGTGLKRAPI